MSIDEYQGGTRRRLYHPGTVATSMDVDVVGLDHSLSTGTAHRINGRKLSDKIAVVNT